MGHDPLLSVEAGRLGGAATARKYGPEYFQQIGRKGGQALVQKYGPEYYSEIGRKGAAARKAALAERAAEANACR